MEVAERKKKKVIEFTRMIRNLGPRLKKEKDDMYV